MAAPKKSRLLCILEYMSLETDEEHPVTIAEITAYLKCAGFDCGWKSVKHDLEQLMDSGIDIICNKGRENQYFVGDRQFELVELKMLVDAVQASRFVSHKRSKALIGKLTAFTSRHQADQLNRYLHIDKQPKTTNESVFYIADVLHAAIGSNKKVAFKYYEYDRNKKKVYKHNRQLYSFSPYGLVWNNDCYYVIGYSDNHNKVIKFRVDRIGSPEVKNEQAVPPPKDFDISSYTKNIFGMFDNAPLCDVTLRCENALMKSVIDRFGEDVETKVSDTEHFCAYVCISASNNFFGWVVGFGGKMEITAPQEVRNGYISLIRSVADKAR